MGPPSCFMPPSQIELKPPLNITGFWSILAVTSPYFGDLDAWVCCGGGGGNRVVVGGKGERN